MERKRRICDLTSSKLVTALPVKLLPHKLTARLGPYWLILEPSGESTWRLQLWGESHLEAEVTAPDEEEAKEAAVLATVELVQKQNPDFRQPATVVWNPAFTSENRL